ncbi:MAG: hypothetical protein ACM3QW_00720 [Ignavibacteriales bacterium]
MQRAFWLFLMFMAVAPFFAVGIILNRYFPNYFYWLGIAIVVTLLIHAFQLPHAMRISRPMSVPTTEVVCKTMLFGFTWWKPLQMGVWGGQD